jgi:hypothetical protein
MEAGSVGPGIEQWLVVSGQWTVDSGQWTVKSEERAGGLWNLASPPEVRNCHQNGERTEK